MAKQKYRDTTLTKQHFAEEIGRWGENQLRSYYGLTANERLADTAQGLIFFITMTFDQEQMLPLKAANGHLRRPDPSYEFDQATHFYNQLERRLEGRTRQPRARRPLMIVGLDFDGSRSMRDIPDEFGNLHVHMILAVDPRHKGRIRQVLGLLRFHYKHKLAVLTDSLDIRPFDHEKYSVANTVSYLTKGEAIVQGRQDWGLAIRRYPNPDYKLSRVYRPLTANQRNRKLRVRQLRALCESDRKSAGRSRTTPATSISEEGKEPT